MLHVDAHLDVADARCFAAGISHWARHGELAGLVSSSMLGGASDTSQVVLRMLWSDRAAFEEFRSSPTTRQTWAAAGALGPPRFTCLLPLEWE